MRTTIIRKVFMFYDFLQNNLYVNVPYTLYRCTLYDYDKFHICVDIFFRREQKRQPSDEQIHHNSNPRLTLHKHFTGMFGKMFVRLFKD